MADGDPRTRALLAWYDRHRRDLPWRGRTDPWAILVAEVMLQQTQVPRVAERYGPFLDAFPTPAALAAAPLATALAHWQGLGYPRRVVHLREAAASVAEHGWPDTPEGLRRLPGVGPYTAAAVACFAFGVPVAAVDTNLRRVLSRWEGRPLDLRQAEQVAATLVDPRRPAAWNQAIMDLGALHCRPRRPHCSTCPVADWCTDPAVYQPPPRQAPYAGSRREARGRVLAALLEGPATEAELAQITDLEPARVGEAVSSLLTDGLARRVRDRVAVADR